MQIREQGPHMPKARGQFAEFPQPGSPFTPQATYLGAPVPVLGTDAEDLCTSPFQGFQA